MTEETRKAYHLEMGGHFGLLRGFLRRIEEDVPHHSQIASADVSLLVNLQHAQRSIDVLIDLQKRLFEDERKKAIERTDRVTGNKPSRN